MSITTALKARREALRDREAGFTLIELLVVVIIIGILAAIAIPIYVGVQNNAKDAAVKSDLVNDKTAISAWGQDNNGAVPTAFDPTSGGTYTKYGASFTGADYWGGSSSTPGTKPTYTPGTAGTSNQNAFCLVARGVTGNYFMITSNTSIQTSASTLTCPTTY